MKKKTLSAKVAVTLKHPVTSAKLANFLRTIPPATFVRVNSFDGDITVYWDEER